jgi:hypothetical protein
MKTHCKYQAINKEAVPFLIEPLCVVFFHLDFLKEQHKGDDCTCENKLHYEYTYNTFREIPSLCKNARKQKQNRQLCYSHARFQIEKYIGSTCLQNIINQAHSMSDNHSIEENPGNLDIYALLMETYLYQKRYSLNLFYILLLILSLEENESYQSLVCLRIIIVLLLLNYSLTKKTVKINRTFDNLTRWENDWK